MINQLVIHKQRDLGIGCIVKELKNSYKVNFGLNDCKTVNKDMVRVIDTSKCKTVTFQEFRSRIIEKNSELNHVIVGNELKHYVGIGWITTKVVNDEDLHKYPRVIY